MTLGKNTIEGEELRSFVERVERIELQKKDLGKDRAVVMAEAKQRGFVPNAIGYCVKIRAMKPQDRAENETLRDMYLHSLGLDTEPPLFRQIGLIDVDIHARDTIIEAMKKFAPADGDIVVRVGGVATRIYRDKEGVHSEPVKEKARKEPTEPSPASGRAAKPPVPDVDEAGAEELGREAARDNRPVIDNPFPYGDPRRARFDQGWRHENGSDGMGDD